VHHTVPTYKFRVWRAIAEVDSRDVEHVAHIVVGVAGLVRVDVVTFPLLPRQLQRNCLDRYDLTWRQLQKQSADIHYSLQQLLLTDRSLVSNTAALRCHRFKANSERPTQLNSTQLN